nr:MAG: hypothetical protein [Helarchaeota virus Nidhogg Meg22_1012]
MAIRYGSFVIARKGNLIMIISLARSRRNKNMVIVFIEMNNKIIKMQADEYVAWLKSQQSGTSMIAYFCQFAAKVKRR